ncbi:hypothetical protein ACFV2B_15480 [Streptomyces lavendulae]|uniref:hypothetical protein n=1 Tax=Streptomyces lavendulae TaxID=1914 RepID=UPI00368AA18C
METVVQWVRTSWTKRSRGGPEASRRNATPTAFPLPLVSPPFVHEVLMHEADAFKPQFATHAALPDSDADTSSVLLEEDDGLLRIRLAVTPFGMPRRWRRPPAVRLARGEWLRWQVNYRFAGSHGDAWTYRLDTFNIAYGPAPTDLFLGTPTQRVNELAALR